MVRTHSFSKGSSRALSGLVHMGPVSQGSALRLHPGLNSYAASRLDDSEALPRLLKRADAKDVRPYSALLAGRR
jgi:hypothetical protein